MRKKLTSSSRANGVHIERVTAVSDDLVAGVRRLVTELEPAAAAQARRRLRECLSSDSCQLLVAYQSGTREPLGMLLLVQYPLLTGRHFWIEDVAVAAAARRQGVGEALVRRALHLARRAGARDVDLTCRPSREAANRLYQRVGFERRESNLYRFRLRADSAD